MSLGRTAAILAILALVVVAWAESGTPQGVTAVSIEAAKKSGVGGQKGSAGRGPVRGGQSDQQVATGPYVDPALVEGSAHGFLPRIGADGRRPSDTYAARSAVQTTRPVGIIIVGLGLKSELLRLVMSEIREPVSLAFTPYGDSLEADTRRVRRRGHETFLLLPTRLPKTAARHDPGPRAILAAQATKERRDRLHWNMARFAGYVGVLALIPARPLGIAPELAKRGVYFLAPDSEYVDRGGKLRIVAADSFSSAKLEAALNEAARTQTDRTQSQGSPGIIVAIPALPAAIKDLGRWMVRAASARDGAMAVPVSRLLKP